MWCFAGQSSCLPSLRTGRKSARLAGVVRGDGETDRDRGGAPARSIVPGAALLRSSPALTAPPDPPGSPAPGISRFSPAPAAQGTIRGVSGALGPDRRPQRLRARRDARAVPGPRARRADSCCPGPPDGRRAPDRPSAPCDLSHHPRIYRDIPRHIGMSGDPEIRPATQQILKAKRKYRSSSV